MKKILWNNKIHSITIILSNIFLIQQKISKIKKIIVTNKIKKIII